MLPMTNGTVAYLRVSTDGQADSGLGLEAQRTRVRGFAAAYAHDLAGEIVDGGASAKNLDRPGMGQLLDGIRSGVIGRVIVAKLDRLTRSPRDLQYLLELFERHGVALVSVAETLDTASAAGRLVVNVMISVAQWEREAIGERTREALAAKRNRGERTGTVPFGFSLAPDGKLTENTDEQRALEIVRQLRGEGWTLGAIADELNRQGFTSRSGRPYRYQHVQQVLTPATVLRRWRKATERRKAQLPLVAFG